MRIRCETAAVSADSDRGQFAWSVMCKCKTLLGSFFKKNIYIIL